LDRSNEIPLATPPRLQIEGFVIDFGRYGRGAAVELRPQAFQVLRHLAVNAGRLVTKDELLAAVWPGAVVTDDSVIQAIGDVRHALGDCGRRVIKTMPRRGYILVGPRWFEGERLGSWRHPRSVRNVRVLGISWRYFSGACCWQR
jgi:DNA-binding response OmpR family regulator